MNNENKTEETKSSSKKSSVKVWIYRILMIVCIGVFAFSGWKIFQIWQGTNQISQETEELHSYLQTDKPYEDENKDDPEPAKPASFAVDWAGLKAANPNVVAWLIVPGTGISYPVVQASDNSYYLNHTFNGASNYIGAIFLDTAANPDFRDDNSIIYGHSVDIGGMFTPLKDFANREFFDSHSIFWLLTPNENYRATIIDFYQGSDDSAVYTTSFGDFRDQVLQQIHDEALYTRNYDTADRHFVTLSTCNLDYGFHSDQRYVLVGALEEWSAPIPASDES